MSKTTITSVVDPSDNLTLEPGVVWIHTHTEVAKTWDGEKWVTSEEDSGEDDESFDDQTTDDDDGE